MKRINITRAAAVASFTGLLAFASLAIAADQKPAAKPAAPAYTDLAKLPKFEHVRVVHATSEQRAAANAKPALPMVAQKAYLDSNGNLRSITAEDLAMEVKAAVPAGASAAVSSPTLSTSASGGRIGLLDESSNVYSVARIGADGKVEQICVDGQPTEKAALKAAAAKGAQEHSHEK